MNNKISIILTCISFLTACGCKSSKTDDAAMAVAPTVVDSITEALDYQVTHYPSSQYRDVYKNFMQDFFGPGHILADTAASGRYLRQELAEEGPFDGPLYEKTGFRGNFYRVNLSVIKDSIIPYEIFFPAFVESVQGITPPSGEEWMKTWNLIDSVIMAKGLHFPDEEIDKEALSDQFAEGNYIVHHSRRFNDSVHFHYRIISRDNFEKIILPLINKKFSD
ncbi:MAG: hypothetical protein K2H72_01540 [Muribaculaceae bacterium]|nr:hypothetical protein [Muribaculaceae bacterium]